MPFTPAHVAAVLPLLQGKKTRWSATGLILGSVTPDFEKFMRLSAHNGHSHSWASLFYFSFPVALGLAFLFHGVVRNPLIAHLPPPLLQRLARFRHFDWPCYFRLHRVRVGLSVLLGASTHLFWDSFTHREGELVALWPFLRVACHVGRLYAPVFVVVNLLSSVVGVWLVLAALRRLPVAVGPPVLPPLAGARPRYWGMVGLVAGALLLGRLLLASSSISDIDVIISVLSGVMVGVGVASVYFRGPAASAGRVPG